MPMLHNHDMDDMDKYADYDPQANDRQARRKRKKKPNHQPKKQNTEILNEVADSIGLESGFETTYQPARYEAGWLLSSLRTFYDQDLITDVLAVVKGGKEASVYRCEANPKTTGATLLAAKVYRPRKFRNLRNDKLYRQGRQVLGVAGKPVDERDWRARKAMDRKTGLGVQMQHTSWLMYEYQTLQALYDAGAAVPRPIAAGENAILMGYLGDADQAAPTLNEIQLHEDELVPLFQDVLRNIELMLQHGVVHGDLSAFNILYWDGAINLIDFPQVVDLHNNEHAAAIFERDVQRVCEYFSKLGLPANPERITRKLWRRYGPSTEAPEIIVENMQPPDDD